MPSKLTLLGPFIFTVVSLKKGPTIPIVLHTAWAHALSAIVIVCPHGKMHAIQIKSLYISENHILILHRRTETAQKVLLTRQKSHKFNGTISRRIGP